jgi:hypothetical protein
LQEKERNKERKKLLQNTKKFKKVNDFIKWEVDQHVVLKQIFLDEKNKK